MVTGAVCIDLTKAFDRVNDSIAYKWFESYLSNRCPVTACNNNQSDQATVFLGVPQSSILGLLLFTVYINDLPDVLEHCDIALLYGDDTAFISSKSISCIESKLNSDLDKISILLICNELTLTIIKSKFIITGYKADSVVNWVLLQ